MIRSRGEWERGRWAERRGLSIPLGFWLLVLACVPMGGAAWFAAAEIDSITEESTAVTAADAAVGEYLDLTALEAGLLDERNWLLLIDGIEDLGVTLEQVREYTGIDLDAELNEAWLGIDQLMAEYGTSENLAALSQTRSVAGLADDGLGYLELEQTFAVRSDRILNDLRSAAGQISGGAGLSESLRVLDLATRAARSTALRQTSYFTALFDLNIPDGHRIGVLASQGALHDASTEALRAGLVTGSAAASAFQDFVNNEGLRIIDEAIDNIVAVSLAEGPGTVELAAVTLFADLDQLIAVFQGGAASSDAHLAIVVAAGDDVEQASAQLIIASKASARSTVIVILTVAGLSLAIVLAVGIFIAGPLRRLSDRANELRDGAPVSDLKLRGPREIQRVHRAIAEAADNLELAERQASSLASGELDSPVLKEAVPGSLGVSLQRAVSRLASSLAEAERYRTQLAHEASHDALTELANRRASMAHLEAALARTRRTDGHLAVLFIDLDGFKNVNDTHGHLAGDAILRESAIRLRRGLRGGDQIGRLGGDEFLVIAEPIGGPEETMVVANRLRSSLSEAFHYEGVEISIDTSIGVAITEGGNITADEMLNDADAALYRAKELGRGRIEICDDDLQAQIRDESQLRTAIEQGLVGDEFLLHFQPVINQRTRSVSSVEALVRWQRPGHGLVQPSGFIDFAEYSDLICEIDRWVICSAARQLAKWSQVKALADVPVAVNVSARHVMSDSFLDDVLGPLAEFGVDRHRLTVEVTETALIGDLELVAGKLATLSEAGVGIAIDDFGTGYTSLAYLRALHFDILKIDRSFVADPSATSLIKLIIDTGHLIGASITAEGIETEDEASRLAHLGCDELQGYLFSKPTTADELELRLPTVLRRLKDMTSLPAPTENSAPVTEAASARSLSLTRQS